LASLLKATGDVDEPPVSAPMDMACKFRPMQRKMAMLAHED